MMQVQDEESGYNFRPLLKFLRFPPLYLTGYLRYVHAKATLKSYALAALEGFPSCSCPAKRGVTWVASILQYINLHQVPWRRKGKSILTFLSRLAK
ncbi:hypothetical protein FRC03_002286 [Tulasnella sp. 419]|nr:hypothetical protein FRC03_002286 [Tulasnella sp. 419]